MYPLEPLREAWDTVYGMVARDVLEAPNELRWDLDPHDTWMSPQLVLGMSCGWPLVTQLLRRVRVIGTFMYRLEGSIGHTYRSVIVAREATSVVALSGSTLAFNSTESLSGYISMMASLPPDQIGWGGPTLETGSHIMSLAAVREGSADIASIDAVMWSYVQQEAPELLEGLVVIDRGPEIPHLPLITSRDASDAAVADWRGALGDGVRNPALSPALDRLLIHGFMPLDSSHYEALLAPFHRTWL